MKKLYFKILALTTGVLAAASCRFLEIEKIGKSDIETYFSEVSALQPALNGCYNLLYSLYDREMLAYPEIAGDLVDLSANATSWWNVYNFASLYSEETTAVGYIWKLGYNVIQNINYIIEYAPGLKEDNPGQVAAIDNILAQAYFLRALVHFDLCCSYAQNYTWTADASHLGVPVMTRIPVVTEKFRRRTVGEVYSRVISDLETALSTFSPDFKFNEYFASPDACKALLARVNLYKGDFAKAAGYSKEVMAAFPLTSRDDYRKMFVNVATRGGESIFRLNGYDQGQTVRNLYYYENPSAVPSDKLKSLFKDSRDVRLSLFSHRAYSSALGKSVEYSNVNMKFCCTDSTANELDKHFDPFVLRCSEMYLINAEANCELGNTAAAEECIKALEARALGISASEVQLEYSGTSQLQDLIQEERMKELCFEGHRLFDAARRHETLKRARTSTAEVLTLTYPSDYFVLPIPYLEMESNDEMVQNPGYSNV